MPGALPRRCEVRFSWLSAPPHARQCVFDALDEGLACVAAIAQRTCIWHRLLLLRFSAGSVPWRSFTLAVYGPSVRQASGGAARQRADAFAAIIRRFFRRAFFRLFHAGRAGADCIRPLASHRRAAFESIQEPPWLSGPALFFCGAAPLATACAPACAAKGRN